MYFAGYIPLLSPNFRINSMNIDILRKTYKIEGTMI